MVWESILTGMDRPDILSKPHMRELRDELAAMIQTMKALANEQAFLEGRRQAVTQELRITQAKGEDLVVRVRAALRSLLGHRNEGLVRFHVRPIRRRSRRVSEEIGVATLNQATEAKPAAAVPDPNDDSREES
jgi:hypothetical protein